MRKGFMIVILVIVGLAWQYIDHLSVGTVKKTMIVYPPVMQDLQYEKNSALSQLNMIREAMGMNTLVENRALAEAAQNHAEYLVKNHEKNHFEIEGHQKFTGVSPRDRVLYAQYSTRQVSENLSTSHHSGKESIDGLFSAIYHRFGFLDIGIDEIGVGVAQQVSDSRNSAFVYDMGNSLLGDLCQDHLFSGVGRYVYKVCKEEKHKIDIKAFKRAKSYHQKTNPEIIFYPYDGQTEVPPAFYTEDPDPLPDMEVSGFPVSVVFNSYHFKQVEVETFKLYHVDDNTEVPVRLMQDDDDPNGRFTEREFAIFPLTRLDYNSEYRAELSYRVGKELLHKSWIFHTVKILEDLYVIYQPQQTIRVRADKSSVLYFKPLDSHDKLQDIYYPQDISLLFLDNHTIRITFLTENKDDFVLKSGEREIEIIVE